ncbi:hypothetical protein T4A_6951 [Trichinella pseudospiralis]|uniref:Uncharacterized protein n=1 Tax=Trichinella pseudospiralis TaxID=6337 RepID=A0A0V1EGU5_TRIPS|nr:hypothetical protein T4A_6951 [Trichinella pseudospiralis]
MLTLMSESDGSLHHMLKKNTDNFCSLHIKQYETIRIWEITFNDFFEIMLIPVKFRLWLSHTYTHITAIKYLEIVKKTSTLIIHYLVGQADKTIVMEDYDTICERKVEICLQKRMMNVNEKWRFVLKNE